MNWTAPTLNTDGTPCSNLAGYIITYSTAMDVFPQAVNISSPSATTYTIKNLTSGTWYFQVSAYNATGDESAPSNGVSKTIP